MMSYKIKRQPTITVQTTLQTDMSANRGEWTGTGVFGAQYATLTQGQTLISVKEFRYGVATFDFYTDDPTDIVVGFRASGNDYAYFTADQFEAAKHGVAATPEAIALAADTWYHAKLIWCPQYVAIIIWDVDNTEIGSSTKRTPSNREMRLYFEVLAATGATLYVGGVTCQEADDPAFFLEEEEVVIPLSRQSTWCNMEPFGGASWGAGNGPYIQIAGGNDGHSIRANQAIHANPERPFTQWRLTFFYRCTAAAAGWLRTWIGDHHCNEAWSWNRLSNSLQGFTYSTATSWIRCLTKGWYAWDGEMIYVAWVLTEQGSGNDVQIYGALLQYE